MGIDEATQPNVKSEDKNGLRENSEVYHHLREE